MFIPVNGFKVSSELETKALVVILQAASFICRETNLVMGSMDFMEMLGKSVGKVVLDEGWSQASINMVASMLHAFCGVSSLTMFDAFVRYKGFTTQFDFDSDDILSMSHPGSDIRSFGIINETVEDLRRLGWDGRICPFAGAARRVWIAVYNDVPRSADFHRDVERVRARQFSTHETLGSLVEYTYGE